jgi:alpha-L-rhamnosidase
LRPEYVPFQGGFRDSPEWGSAAVIIPWQLYKWYGNEAVLQKAYPMMKRYVQYLQTTAKDNIISHGLGDWFDLGPKQPGEAQLTPKAVTATSIYYYDLQIITKVAEMLGFNEDSKGIRKSFSTSKRCIS